MDKTAISISTIFAIVALAALGGMTYGCTVTNQSYYQMAHECTQAGGSFIPIEGNTKAICLMAK